MEGLLIALRNYAVVSEEFSNGLRLAWRDSSNNPHNMIVVRLSTFQDLETRVAQLEQQVGTLFGTSGQNETDLTQVTSQISSIFAFVTNHASRLNAAGL